MKVEKVKKPKRQGNEMKERKQDGSKNVAGMEKVKWRGKRNEKGNRNSQTQRKQRCQIKWKWGRKEKRKKEEMK